MPVGYCQALLDLVKAFDNVPHWLLIREGIELGYPLWLLRLSMSVYRMKRVIRVATAVSRELLPRCGITAGSGFACAEMKVVMIRMVDEARQLYRTIVPTLFVDDLAAEQTGPHTHIQKDLGGFIEHVVEAMETNGMKLNRSKSVFTASTDGLGALMEKRWAGIGLKYYRKVKALGAGMGGGRRRNVDTMTERLIKFRQRLPRFRRLRRIGISTVRLLKTGGKAGMTYAEGILGVSNSMLRCQRRAVAAVAAPASGCGGQNLDAALLVADGGPRSHVDPAYDAHPLSIGEWATAV